MFKGSVAARFARAAFSSLLLVVATPSLAHSAEIKLLGPVSLRVVLPGVLPQFETSLGHRVTVGYATLGAITKRMIEGESVDVAMVSPAQNEDLQKQGKLVGGSRAEMARSGLHRLRKEGRTQARRELGGCAEAHAAGGKVDRSGRPGRRRRSWRLHSRLDATLSGVADEIKAKTRLVRSGTEVAEAVAAEGEAEIGIGVASDAAIIPGLDATPLPTGAQSYSVYVAGVSAGSRTF